MRTNTSATAPIADDSNSTGRRSASGWQRRSQRRLAVLTAMLAVLFGHDPALAQMVDTVPAIGATSPLGMTAGTPVAPTGYGMGATELPSAGLSPVPTASIGITGNGVACPAATSSPAETSGTAATYDGGGMTMGMPASGTCDSSSTSGAATSAMSTASPGGASPAGIPMGSVEIGGGGLSPMPAGPAPNPMPLVAGTNAYPSMTMAPDGSLPTISLPNAFTPAVEIGGPCTTTGASVPSMSSTGC